MAHKHEDPEKIHYVGDSRIRATKERQYPKDYSEYPGKTEAFFPDFLLREWMVAVIVLVGFMALVLAKEAPLESIADPTNTAYTPIPDWYFLFLYQLLKYDWSSGILTPIGTVVIPGIAFGALVLAPWLDRGKERRPFRRPVATYSMLLSIVAIVYLTWAAWDEYSQSQMAQDGGQGGGEQDLVIVNEDSEGYEIYQSSSCVACHASDLSGASAPALLGIGDKFNEEEIIDIIDDGIGTMPPQGDTLEADEKETLAAWLAEQKAGGGDEEDGEEDEGEDATES